MPTKQQYYELESAIDHWIKADWAFRFGPAAYTHRTHVLLVDAEMRLRRARTGVRSLRKAYKKLRKSGTRQYLRS